MLNYLNSHILNKGRLLILKFKTCGNVTLCWEKTMLYRLNSYLLNKG